MTAFTTCSVTMVIRAQGKSVNMENQKRDDDFGAAESNR